MFLLVVSAGAVLACAAPFTGTFFLLPLLAFLNACGARDRPRRCGFTALLHAASPLILPQTAFSSAPLLGVSLVLWGLVAWTALRLYHARASKG